MASKSWPIKSAVQCYASSRHLGCHTQPVISAVEDCRSDGRKASFKRNSKERLERENKGSRKSHAVSGLTSSKDCRENQSLSGRGNVAAAGTSEKKTSSERMSTANESEQRPRKTSSGSSAEDHTQTVSSSSLTEDALTTTAIDVSSEAEVRKRKSEETEGPNKRSRGTPSPGEGPSHQATNKVPSSTCNPGTSSSANTVLPDSRAAFEARYTEGVMLGEGGFGSVYAGYRKDDNLPVAIKYIPQISVGRTSMYLGGKHCRIPIEVALLLKLRPAAAETSAAVTLLDWYDLDDELILVLERPDPCMDLVDYMNSRGSALPEQEAKIIVKQLVDALIEIHSRGVFHRDIKMDNILIEIGNDVPRVRLIDFGCGTYLSEGIYIKEQGTYIYGSPEWFLNGWYRAGPTSVWQLGVVLFGILHRALPFQNSTEIIYGNPPIRDGLSVDCQGFLLSCLVKSSTARPTLNTLKHHPWLIQAGPPRTTN